MGLLHDIHNGLDGLTSDLALGSPANLRAQGNHGCLQFEVLAVEQLACSLGQIVYHANQPCAESQEDLKTLGDELARRVNYLLEPIGSQELDGQSTTLQMRSVPPSVDRDHRSYYELLLRLNGQIELTRYEQADRSPRTKTPLELTRQVLVRLAEDFDGLASGE